MSSFVTKKIKNLRKSLPFDCLRGQNKHADMPLKIWKDEDLILISDLILINYPSLDGDFGSLGFLVAGKHSFCRLVDGKIFPQIPKKWEKCCCNRSSDFERIFNYNYDSDELRLTKADKFLHGKLERCYHTTPENKLITQDDFSYLVLEQVRKSELLNIDENGKLIDYKITYKTACDIEELFQRAYAQVGAKVLKVAEDCEERQKEHALERTKSLLDDTTRHQQMSEYIEGENTRSQIKQDKQAIRGEYNF